MFKYYFFLFAFTFSSINADVLSKKDQDLYGMIFNDYRNGNFKDAEIYIAKLQNNLLLGHVEALKLLHPTKHRSSFLELKTWLEDYSDHYESKRIYKLGVKRMPIGAKSPKKPSTPILKKNTLLRKKIRKI